MPKSLLKRTCPGIMIVQRTTYATYKTTPIKFVKYLSAPVSFYYSFNSPGLFGQLQPFYNIIFIHCLTFLTSITQKQPLSTNMLKYLVFAVPIEISLFYRKFMARETHCVNLLA